MNSIQEIIKAIKELQSCVTLLQGEFREFRERQAPDINTEKKMSQSERMKAYWANKKKG